MQEGRRLSVLVRVDPRYLRPTEVHTLLGGASKARQALGWRPAVTFAELMAGMVAAGVAKLASWPREAARLTGVTKTMLLGSSCVYPRLAPQPVTEDSLLTGPLEETNQWYTQSPEESGCTTPRVGVAAGAKSKRYPGFEEAGGYAIARIAGVKMAQAYRRQYGMNVASVMPANLYGSNDRYDPHNSHVAASLLRRLHQARVEGARQVEIWGTGTPRREFLHVDDLARACVFLTKTWSDPDPMNIGSGQEVTIIELARLIAEVVDWSGEFVFDKSKPDGTPRKLLDVSRLTAPGWTASIPLREGLADAYRDFTTRWDAGEFVPRATA